MLPIIHSDITNCGVCTIANEITEQTKETAIELPERRFDHVAIDFPCSQASPTYRG